MRVLVVDDESLIRMDLRDILESQGHTVIGEGANGVKQSNYATPLRQI